MISRIFIERPRFAMVVSLVIFLAGLLAMLNIPIAQYPKITPPEILVRANYPGANAEVVADSIASVIEAEVNGVENMIYMSSTCSNSGSYSLSVIFKVGTDPDIAQVNVMNRVKQAEAKLPDDVVSQGITVRTRSSDILALILFTSPKGTYDNLFLSNFVSINVKDVLARVPGVSEAMIFGSLDYSMRVWLDPNQLASLGLTADDVVTAIRNQNILAAAGSVGTMPSAPDQQIQFTLQGKGRLQTVADFENIVIRSNGEGGLLRLRDVARIELGAKTYDAKASLNGFPAVPMAVYQSAGSNALETMNGVKAVLDRVAGNFPPDVSYSLTYDATAFVSATIEEIIFTLLLTFFLVVTVTFIFLQDWRATLIPALTIPVSLIGTFAALLALGYSANTMTLFALILAIGLVVDDAIVIVENTQRVMMEEKLGAKAAALKSMEQVTSAVIAMTLVLLAVFIPVGFLPGITGQLYRQFAVTICFAVLLSAVSALTLSPALCSILLRPPKAIRRGPLAWFTGALNRSRNGYVRTSAWLIRRTFVVLGIFLLVFASSYGLFKTRPTSFLPNEDKGVIFMDIQLPEASALARTARVTDQIEKKLLAIDGVADIITVNGMSIISGASENVALCVVTLDPWEKRAAPNLRIGALMQRIRGELATIPSANINAFTPPAISGLGLVGGFDFRLQAMGNQSPQDLASVAQGLVVAANQDPAILTAFTTYSANVPRVFVNLDRDKAESLKVPVSRVFGTLQAQLGSLYVNDFNLYNRVYQVKAQADTAFRDTVDDVGNLYVRSDGGQMVPLSSLVAISTVLGPQSVIRYNQFPSATINGVAAFGTSSGQAMDAMEKLASRTLPDGYGFEWSGLSLQEKESSGQAPILIALALLFGYLFLVAQYESWIIPLPVIISISVASLGALAALWIARIDLSVYAQIGLVLLVGLASKNAILIVEFSKTRYETGVSLVDAALTGARLRFRAVLMTAFSFIMAVTPLVFAGGAGAASRRSIGTTVFGGMVAATLVGIFMIPSLYVIFQRLRERLKERIRRVAGKKTSEPPAEKTLID